MTLNRLIRICLHLTYWWSYNLQFTLFGIQIQVYSRAWCKYMKIKWRLNGIDGIKNFHISQTFSLEWFEWSWWECEWKNHSKASSRISSTQNPKFSVLTDSPWCLWFGVLWTWNVGEWMMRMRKIYDFILGFWLKCVISFNESSIENRTKTPKKNNMNSYKISPPLATTHSLLQAKSTNQFLAFHFAPHVEKYFDRRKLPHSWCLCFIQKQIEWETSSNLRGIQSEFCEIFCWLFSDISNLVHNRTFLLP